MEGKIWTLSCRHNTRHAQFNNESICICNHTVVASLYSVALWLVFSTLFLSLTHGTSTPTHTPMALSQCCTCFFYFHCTFSSMSTSLYNSTTITPPTPHWDPTACAGSAGVGHGREARCYGFNSTIGHPRGLPQRRRLTLPVHLLHPPMHPPSLQAPHSRFYRSPHPRPCHQRHRRQGHDTGLLHFFHYQNYFSNEGD